MRRASGWVVVAVLLLNLSWHAVAIARDAPVPSIDSATGSWRYLPTAPLGRYDCSTDYDPIGDRMLIHGGWSGTGTLDDGWGLQFAPALDWRYFGPAGPVRRNTAHVFDPVRNRWVLFGGAAFFVDSNLTYVLSMSGAPTWSRLATTGSAPSPREAASAVRDTKRDRMVVFGGSADANGGYFNEVRALGLSTSAWSAITPAGAPPMARSKASAIYDGSRDRLVVFGGRDTTHQYQDVWTLNFTGTPTWTHLSTIGTPPAGRYDAAACYDSLSDRMIVFGGTTSGGALSDTWSLSLASGAWTQLDSGANGPPPRSAFSSAYDSKRRRLLIFGGVYTLRETWGLSMADPTHWTLVDQGAAPPAYAAESAVADPQHDRMYFFGGGIEGGGYTNEVTQLDLGEDRYTWPKPTGAQPPGGYVKPMVLDAPRGRLIVFDEGTGGVWAMTLEPPVWSFVNTSGTAPGAQSQSVGVSDAARQRMLLFSGASASIYALDLVTATWSMISAAGGPGTRQRPAAIYDPVHDRLVLVGGTQSSGPPDAWSLSLAGTPAWTQLSPSGSAPTMSWPWTGTYDSVLGRMLIYGGNYTRFDPVVAFALSLGASPAWTALASSPLSQYGGSAIAFDAARDRMVLHGGGYSSGLGFLHTQYETYGLSFATTLSVPPLIDSRSGILGVRPNPGRDEQSIGFDIVAGDESATLDIIDVTGQRVWSAGPAALEIGRHVVRWAGIDSRGRRCAPGIYWAKLRTRRGNRAVRFVRVK